MRKVCLPPKDIDMSKLGKCWISGWGDVKSSTQFNATNHKPTILQWGQVSLWSNEDCQRKHSMTSLKPINITENLLCASMTGIVLVPHSSNLARSHLSLSCKYAVNFIMKFKIAEDLEKLV